MENDQIVIYQSTDGNSEIDVRLTDDTVWLTAHQMASLFERNIDTITLHIRNLYKEGELIEEATSEESSEVQMEAGRSVRRKNKRYNLDVIISVGYRVKSQRGTQFRIWANNVLKDYLRKGYAINEKLLKEKAAQFNSLKHTVNLLGNDKPVTPSANTENLHLHTMIKNNWF